MHPTYLKLFLPLYRVGPLTTTIRQRLGRAQLDSRLVFMTEQQRSQLPKARTLYAENHHHLIKLKYFIAPYRPERSRVTIKKLR